MITHQERGRAKLPRAPTNRPHDLLAWPLQELADLDSWDLPVWVSHFDLQSEESWLPDQMLGLFGQWQVELVDGKPDPRATVRRNCENNPWQQGLWQLACRLPRSALMRKQIARPQHSALVPLILAGIKQYQSIPYSEWRRENLGDIMLGDLAHALDSPWPDFTREEVLEWRTQGLVYKTGKKQGQSRRPESAWGLYGVQDLPIGELPHLQQVMVAQIWCAHPTIRHSNMILHTANWDEMPEPLISQEPAKWSSQPWN